MVRMFEVVKSTNGVDSSEEGSDVRSMISSLFGFICGGMMINVMPATRGRDEGKDRSEIRKMNKSVNEDDCAYLYVR